ncbi:RHS repeat-associated core domain-containing protein [Cellulosimicrobium cellulans]|uniref:RHS repeat-associated core domain-containing protein n=1 Tax=Cellulosimicrobium cellulans TaxID=1710 RepID=UPI00130D734D|nr:RHS repeat-associated core domain-containing protein [Cellulosimicrobium cellulans]
MRGAVGNLDGQSMYIYDNLGSPLTIITQSNTTSDAWECDPYGVADLTEESIAQVYTPFAYTGGLNDRVTGWTLNGARYYDAGEGRWTQMDTLDSPLDPSNANRYAYAANNPINFIDPTGLYGTADIVGDVVGVAVTALFTAAGTAIGTLVGNVPGAVSGRTIGRCVGGCIGGYLGDSISNIWGERGGYDAGSGLRACAAGALTAGIAG